MVYSGIHKIIRFFLSLAGKMYRMDLKAFPGKYLHWIVLLLLAITVVILTVFSEGYPGGADNINHYFISRYSFKYPHLFFESWGRPLYTFISSPFAQFGFLSVKLLNVFLGLCTAYVAYLIAKRIEIKPAFFVMILVIFTPQYCEMLPTSLTEILFSFMLVFAGYLFFTEKYILSALIISFLPFARSEGIIMFPVFFLAFLLKGKWRAIPFLITGFLVLSIAGTFFFKDFFWIITKFPYPLHHEIYQTRGPLFHFVNSWRFIFGAPVLILTLAGIARLLLEFIKKRCSFKSETFYIILLILVPSAGYFVFHSFLYWQAMGGSIGLVRVIAGVLPLGAIIALMGYQWISEKLYHEPWQKIGIMIVTTIAVIIFCFRTYPFPVKLNPEERLIKNTTEWVKEKRLANHKIIFTDLNVPFFLDLDPYDGKRCAQKWFVDHKDPFPYVHDSAVFIWDSHFGPNECSVPLDSLMQNPYYKLLNVFLPDGELKTYGGYDYMVCVFLRAPVPSGFDNKSFFDGMILAQRENGTLLFTKKLDFEFRKTVTDTTHFSRTTVFSGNSAFCVAPDREFTPGMTIHCKDLSSYRNGLMVKASVAVFPVVPFSENRTSLIISLEDDNKSYKYKSVLLSDRAPVVNQWTIVDATVTLPEIKSEKDKLKIYLWHEGKQLFYMDDFKVDILVKRSQVKQE